MVFALLIAAAAAAASVWQVEPLVVVDAGNPVLCGYIYTHGEGIELRIEKGVREGAVFTAIEIRGAGLARLTTLSFDSARDLGPAVQAGDDLVRLQGDLEERDAGGLLFAELAVTGGVLRTARRGTEDSLGAPAWTSHALPAPLPRGVSAMYLNCAGDLIRPE